MVGFVQLTNYLSARLLAQFIEGKCTADKGKIGHRKRKEEVNNGEVAEKGNELKQQKGENLSKKQEDCEDREKDYVTSYTSATGMQGDRLEINDVTENTNY